MTSNAGLQRTVCGNCGHVSLGYLHDTFQFLDDIEMADPVLTGQED